MKIVAKKTKRMRIAAKGLTMGTEMKIVAKKTKRMRIATLPQLAMMLMKGVLLVERMLMRGVVIVMTHMTLIKHVAV